MIIRILNTGTNAYISPNVARVVRVYNHRVPSGILESEFTQKGGVLVGSGAGTYGELPPGSPGQYPTPDASAALGIKWETPSFSVSDASNFLINGGFHFAQRQTPGTLTAISDNTYSADRWKILRENADLQYQRNDATGETGLTSLYYGRYKKITNSGKFMVLQIVEGTNSVAMRGKTVIFQVKMKASSAKTIRMAILELQTGGTIDTMPATPVTAWNVDGTDPTLGTNLAVITGVESKSVTTAWTNFSITVTVPATSKNLICAVWSNADFTAGDTLDMAEAGLFLGANLLAWSPRPISEEVALCQRYYEKTYGLDVAPGTSASGGTEVIRQTIASETASFFSRRFLVMKRGTPTVTWYNPNASNDSGKIYSISGAATRTVTGTYSNDPASAMKPGSPTHAAAGSAGDILWAHWTADAEI